jgi:hypothetical protein
VKAWLSYVSADNGRVQKAWERWIEHGEPVQVVRVSLGDVGSFIEAHGAATNLWLQRLRETRRVGGDGRVYPCDARLEFDLPIPAEGRDCDHKFIDSNACLKCGWIPQPLWTHQRNLKNG